MSELKDYFMSQIVKNPCKAPPHKLTVRSGAEPYGCKDKVYSSGYWMPHRTYAPDGSFTMGSKWIPYRMSTDCGSTDISATDPRCAGCSWQTKEEK